MRSLFAQKRRSLTIQPLMPRLRSHLPAHAAIFTLLLGAVLVMGSLLPLSLLQA